METKKKTGKGIKIFLIIIVVSLLFLSDKGIQRKVINLVKNINTNIREISLEISQSIPLEGAVEEVFSCNRGIVLWDGHKLIKMNNDGLVEKQKEFNFDEPGIYVGDNKIYVYEKPMGVIYILNGEIDTIDKVEVEGKIESLVESNEKLLVHTKEENRESLKIFNKQGKIIENVITENRNILTYSTNKENTKYIISTLNLEGTGITSGIQAFEIGGESLLEYELNEEIILYTSYLAEDKLIVMTDRNLYCIVKDEILWERPYESLKDIYVHRGKIYILYSNSLEVLTVDGDVEYNHSFSEEYKKMIIYDKHLVLYGDEYIIGLKDQEEIFKYKPDDTILKAIKDGKKLVVLYKDKIDLMVF